jgi:hypothetical protein
MKVHYINYANKQFKVQQKIANISATLTNSFDSITSYAPSDIDLDFLEQNSNILSCKRGNGYWLWKPYFILSHLYKIHTNDFLFYTDSGVFFYRSIKPLLETLISLNQDIACFELPLIEEQWTKPSLFVQMHCLDDAKYMKTNQYLSSFHLVRKTMFSIKFYQEYLSLCCNYDLIGDRTSLQQNLIDNPIFFGHRHDQSIFSLLCKRYDLTPIRDPSQFGLFPGGYAGTAFHDYELNHTYTLVSGRQFRVNQTLGLYPIILHHSRRRNQFYSILRFWIACVLFKARLYNGILR